MSTGVLTSVFALVILITVRIFLFCDSFLRLTMFFQLLTLPRSFVWMAIFFVIGRGPLLGPSFSLHR
jgi:hypothetical protein